MKFFDIKDIRKINYNKLARMVPGVSMWLPWTTPAQYMRAVLGSYRTLRDNGIDNALRLAHFLGQGLVETGFLRHKSENLSYSAERLLKIFPRHFRDMREARKYARKPEKIANRVYANRLGNGDEASGDGWRYRGRGFFQLTGKDNYRRYGEYAGIDLVSDPDIISRDLKTSVQVAASFFNATGLGSYADKNDIRAVSRGINRGDPESPYPAHGESERIRWTKEALDLVLDPARIDTAADDYRALPDQPDGLAIGDRGSEVRDLQRALNTLGFNAGTVDGVFGVNTERALVNFQRESGLEITGAADTATLDAIDVALEDPRTVLPIERRDATASDARRAGRTSVGAAQQTGAAGAAVGGAGAVGAANETGALDGVIETGREMIEDFLGGDDAAEGETTGDEVTRDEAEADRVEAGATDAEDSAEGVDAAPSSDETTTESVDDDVTSDASPPQPAEPVEDAAEDIVADAAGPLGVPPGPVADTTEPSDVEPEPGIEVPSVEVPSPGAEVSSEAAGIDGPSVDAPTRDDVVPAVEPAPPPTAETVVDEAVSEAIDEAPTPVVPDIDVDDVPVDAPVELALPETPLDNPPVETAPLATTDPVLVEPAPEGGASETAPAPSAAEEESAEVSASSVDVEPVITDETAAPEESADPDTAPAPEPAPTPQVDEAPLPPIEEPAPQPESEAPTEDAGVVPPSEAPAINDDAPPSEQTEAIEQQPAPSWTGDFLDNLQLDGNLVVLLGIALAGAFIFTRSRAVVKDRLEAFRFNQ